MFDIVRSNWNERAMEIMMVMGIDRDNITTKFKKRKSLPAK